MLHGLSYFLHFVIFYLIIPSSWETEDAIFFPYVFVVWYDCSLLSKLEIKLYQLSLLCNHGF